MPLTWRDGYTTLLTDSTNNLFESPRIYSVKGSNPGETMPIDACNVQLLYQGYDKTVQASSYGLIPYRPALITMTR